MEGFGGFFNDPDFQRRMQEMAEQMQSAQTLAWADNAIKLAVDMTVAAINRINIQGTTEQQAQQIRSVMATVPEAVTPCARRARGSRRSPGRCTRKTGRRRRQGRTQIRRNTSGISGSRTMPGGDRRPPIRVERCGGP